MAMRNLLRQGGPCDIATVQAPPTQWLPSLSTRVRASSAMTTQRLAPGMSRKKAGPGPHILAGFVMAGRHAREVALIQAAQAARQALHAAIDRCCARRGCLRRLCGRCCCRRRRLLRRQRGPAQDAPAKLECAPKGMDAAGEHCADHHDCRKRTVRAAQVSLRVKKGHSPEFPVISCSLSCPCPPVRGSVVY